MSTHKKDSGPQALWTETKGTHTQAEDSCIVLEGTAEGVEAQDSCAAADFAVEGTELCDIAAEGNVVQIAVEGTEMHDIAAEGSVLEGIAAHLLRSLHVSLTFVHRSICTIMLRRNSLWLSVLRLRVVRSNSLRCMVLRRVILRWLILWWLMLHWLVSGYFDLRLIVPGLHVLRLDGVLNMVLWWIGL